MFSTNAFSSRTTLLDGGLGYELFRLGLRDDRESGSWSCLALVEHEFHPIVVQAHLNFLRGGAEIVTTNNYSVVPLVLERMHRPDDWESLTRVATKLAVKSRELWYDEVKAKQKAGEYVRNTSVKICGSLPPLNESYRPDLTYDPEFSIDFYSRLSSVMEDCDYFTAETMSGISEAETAVKGALAGSDKKVMVSFTLLENGLLRDHNTFDDAVKYFSRFPNVSGFYMNCCTPESILNALRGLSEESRLLIKEKGFHLGMYANGLAHDAHPEGYTLQSEQKTRLRDDLTPERYVDFVQMCLDLGCDHVGGCCHIYPEHIQELSNFLMKLEGTGEVAHKL